MLVQGFDIHGRRTGNGHGTALKSEGGLDILRFLPFEGVENKEGLIHEATAPTIFEGEMKEGTEAGSRVLEGLFQRANHRNRNRRIYPLSILERETKKLSEVIREHGGIFGELDHPETVTVNMQKACSRLDVLQMTKGGIVEGKMSLLPTLPMGGWAIGCADALGGKLGVSSRGAGSLLQSGQDIMVGEDYSMRTYDNVHDPSTDGARPAVAVQEQLIREFYEARPSTQRLLLGKSVDEYLGIK